jgi:hypothetical protein
MTNCAVSQAKPACGPTSFRVKGSEAHAAHLALTLHLLGYVVDYDESTQALLVSSD